MNTFTDPAAYAAQQRLGDDLYAARATLARAEGAALEAARAAYACAPNDDSAAYFRAYEAARDAALASLEATLAAERCPLLYASKASLGPGTANPIACLAAALAAPRTHP